MNPEIDAYLEVGCGRCPLGGTPQCKVHLWPAELRRLRSILLECGLKEELKWKVPCYTWQGHNMVILAAFKDYASVSFFKGALLADPAGWLVKPGENSQAARLLTFRRPQEVEEKAAALKAYVFEAIEVEKAGLKVDFKQKDELVLPEELLAQFELHPDLQAAFEALTPGRQRGYVLHFAAPKQSQTRTSRIEKCIPKILEGKGFFD